MRSLLALSAAALATAAATAQPVTIQLNTSDFDRWNYPFNTAVATRALAPTFGSVGVPGGFDDFDAEFLMGFNLAGLLPALGENETYQVNSLVVTATHETGTFIYDDTYDSFNAVLDPMTDADPGRPVYLVGAEVDATFGFVGFEFGLEPAFPMGPPLYYEDTAFGFGDPTAEDVRLAFPVAQPVGGSGLVNVSNAVRDAIEFTPFAVGTVPGLTPGDVVPEGLPGVFAGATFEFNVDLSNPETLAYLEAGLASERLFFSLISLHEVSQQVGGTNPNWYTGDGFDPVRVAPTLTLEIEVVPLSGACSIADVDADGDIDVFDLITFLQNFDPNAACPADAACGIADLDANDAIDVFDLITFLQNFDPADPNCQ